MPQPRKYKSNAERQKAYRDRKRHREAEEAARYASVRVGDEVTDLTTGERLTVRILAADAAAQAAEA